MTSPSFTEAMRVFAECLVEVGVQDHSHNLSKKFVTPNGYTERPLFPVFLQNVGSSCWLPLVSFLLQCSNDGLKGLKPGAVSRFFRHAGRHRASISVDSTVGSEVQVCVVQLPVDAL